MAKPNPHWHLNFVPWAVQLEALRRSRGRKKYGWWMEQGLGKTGAALNEFVGLDDVDLMIVVTPQSFKMDWLVMAEEYGLGFLPRGWWPKHELPWKWEQGIYALNYEAVSRSSAKNELLKLMEARRCMLVLDESFALGSPGSGFTKACIELAKRAAVVRELNGTPMPQNPLNWYGQLRALGEFNGWTATDFKNRYAVLGGYMGKQVLPKVQNEEELARIIDDVSFRALKRDWRKSMPGQVSQLIHLELADKLKPHYMTMLEEFYVMLEEEGEAVTADMVISQMLKLQQIASGFVYVGKDDPRWLVEPKHNIKLQAVVDRCEGQGKAIVVHYFKPSGDLLMEALTKAGLRPARIMGGMKPDEAIEQKRRFNDDSECRVIVGQERAIALGHTLLGQPGRDRCNRIAFFENSFSLYYRQQVEDRNHRGAQDQTCTLYDFVASPIEKAAINILAAKRDMGENMDKVIAAVRASM